MHYCEDLLTSRREGDLLTSGLHPLRSLHSAFTNRNTGALKLVQEDLTGFCPFQFFKPNGHDPSVLPHPFDCVVYPVTVMLLGFWKAGEILNSWYSFDSWAVNYQNGN